MGKNATPELVHKDLKDVVYPYIEKELKFSKFFGVGFCWGAGIAFEAASDAKFIGAASIHGARFTDETLRNLKCPIYYAPAAKDMAADAVKKILDEKDFAKKCVYHTFDTMEHGFCAARGDWTKPDIRKNAELAMSELISFCKDITKS